MTPRRPVRDQTADMRPQLEIDGALAAHVTLLDRLAGLTDDEVHRPSRLPGWCVGHVLTHLARNADSFTHVFLAAHDGAIADQYPGGPAQRSADIEAGADRDAAALLADVRAASARLEAAWAATPIAAWAHGRARDAAGHERDLPEMVFRRWREVEVHLVDLGLGFSWSGWSAGYVDRDLDRAIAGVGPRLAPGTALRIEADGEVGAWMVEPAVAEPGPAARVGLRASKHELLAWLLGRHERADWPALTPW